MKAMILAAGLGTRLRPLTNDRPKALVTVAGRTLLEIALARLREFGVREVIVNAHHYAAMIDEYLKANDGFGMRIELSREEDLLDTGGGLKKAEHFFGESLQEPFILHNVDVLSTINLGRLMQFHSERKALATLAVQEREASRYLLFDTDGQLCGRRAGMGSWSPRSQNRDLGHPRDEKAGWARPSAEAQALGFCGIHILSPRIFAQMNEVGAFSIIATYMKLAARGERIIAYRADDCYWRDLGRPESIAQAEQDVRSGRCVLAGA